MRKKNYPIFFMTLLLAVIVIAIIVMSFRWMMTLDDKKEDRGAVTVHTTDGQVLGYYGTVNIKDDGTDGNMPDIELTDSWLVGIDSEKEEKTSSDPEPLVINIPEPSTVGKFTIYEPDGAVHFDYEGDYFKVINDGSNGEDIEIAVYLPEDSTCSCFRDTEDSTDE